MLAKMKLKLSFFTQKKKGFFWGIFLFLLLSGGCVEQPRKNQFSEFITPRWIPHKGEGSLPKALWFTGANFTTGGYLGRLDLETGRIQRSLLRVGPDAIVISDSSESLFLLSRYAQDAVAVVKGADAQIQHSMALPLDSNPQSAVRDQRGNIWISFLNLNEVYSYSADLKSLLAKVDLTTLGVQNHTSGKVNADLGAMVLWDSETLLVSAQRLHRDRSWVPDRYSGFAFVNTVRQEVESTHLVEVSNPLLVARDESAQSQIVVVGKGDLSDSLGVMGQVLWFEEGMKKKVQTQTLSGKIIAADFSGKNNEPALVVWYPQENKSCLQLGSWSLLCEGSSENLGYVFSSIRYFGNIIFVSYYSHQSSELWVVNFDEHDGVQVQKIPMDLPVMSLSFGP